MHAVLSPRREAAMRKFVFPPTSHCDVGGGCAVSCCSRRWRDAVSVGGSCSTGTIMSTQRLLRATTSYCLRRGSSESRSPPASAAVAASVAARVGVKSAAAARVLHVRRLALGRRETIRLLTLVVIQWLFRLPTADWECCPGSATANILDRQEVRYRSEGEPPTESLRPFRSA